MLSILLNKGLFSGNRLSLHNDILNFCYLPFFPQLYVEGLPFLPPLGVSIVFAGTVFFRPRREPGNTVVVVIVVIIVFSSFVIYLFLIKACFLETVFHYTTIF